MVCALYWDHRTPTKGFEGRLEGRKHLKRHANIGFTLIDIFALFGFLSAVCSENVNGHVCRLIVADLFCIFVKLCLKKEKRKIYRGDDMYNYICTIVVATFHNIEGTLKTYTFVSMLTENLCLKFGISGAHFGIAGRLLHRLKIYLLLLLLLKTDTPP